MQKPCVFGLGLGVRCLCLSPKFESKSSGFKCRRLHEQNRVLGLFMDHEGMYLVSTYLYKPHSIREHTRTPCSNHFVIFYYYCQQ